MVAPKKTHRAYEKTVAIPRLEIGLTAMQERFCQLYATRDDLTQTDCAREAGYAHASAAVAASDLVRQPRIQERVRDLKQALGKKYEVTFENHVRKMAEIRDQAIGAGAWAAAVTAEKHRGQAAGLYIDRKEILHGRIDQMSREDVLKEIANLTKEFPMLEMIATTSQIIEQEPEYDGLSLEELAQLETDDE